MALNLTYLIIVIAVEEFQNVYSGSRQETIYRYH